MSSRQLENVRITRNTELLLHHFASLSKPTYSSTDSSVNMPQKLLKGAQHNLTYAQVQNRTDVFLAAFLHACESNDAASALQLAPDRDAGALTFGLNRAVKGSHLDLARQLLEVGAKWDAETVNLECRSLEAVKLLVESGFDVNTGLVRGGVLLP